MSALVQTVIGALAAIIGGFVGAWYQTNSADRIARSIRRAEHREQGLLELNQQVATVHAVVDSTYQAAKDGQSTSQYQQARQELNGLHEFWDGRSIGVIPDQDVINAYNALIAAEQEHLPSAELGAARQRELSSGAKAVGQQFVQDLGQVLERLGDLKRVLQVKAKEIRGLHEMSDSGSRPHLKTGAAAPLPVLGRCASCAPGRLAIELPGLLAVGGCGWWLGWAVPSALDCPGRVRRVKAEPHAVASRA